MSVKIMSRVWHDTPLRENDLLVLLALADWANDNAQCWPSYPSIAAKSRIDERTAKAIVARLLHAGYISVERGGGRHKSNLYTIHVPPLGSPTPTTTPHPHETVTPHHPLDPPTPDPTVTKTVVKAPPNGGATNNKPWRAHAQNAHIRQLTIIKEPSETRALDSLSNHPPENRQLPHPGSAAPLPLPLPLLPPTPRRCHYPGCRSPLVQRNHTTNYCQEHGDPTNAYITARRFA